MGANSYGRRRVEQILYHHGLDKETVREVTEEVFSNSEREEEKLDDILKKAAREQDLKDPSLRNKIFAKLARRGYSSSAISAAMSRYEEMRKDETF